MPVAFVDANIPVYAAGEPHPCKRPAVEILALASRSSGALVSDSEVLQELFHLYLRRGQLPRASEVIRTFDQSLHGRVERVLREDVLTALGGLAASTRLQSRDLIHLAVMERLGVSNIVTADRAFDGVDAVRRLDPLRLADWRDEVFGAR